MGDEYSESFVLDYKPPLDTLANRFYNLDDIVFVRIDYIGYLIELKENAPFIGNMKVRDVINVMNRTINVVFNDDDLIKMRNAVVFYNEYFCKSEDGKSFKAKPAYIAADILDKKYELLLNKNNVETKKKNFLFNNPLEGLFHDCELPIMTIDKSQVDDALSRYMATRKKETQKVDTKVISKNRTMYKEFCEHPMNQIPISLHGFYPELDEVELYLS